MALTWWSCGGLAVTDVAYAGENMNKLELAVETVLSKHGWETFHSGWPDFLCAKDGKVMAVEVKSRQDRVSADQARVHKILFEAGIRVKTIWLNDVDDGRLASLTHGASRRVHGSVRKCGKRPMWYGRWRETVIKDGKPVRTERNRAIGFCSEISREDALFMLRKMLDERESDPSVVDLGLPPRKSRSNTW